MVKRYIPSGSFSLGRGKLFIENHKRKDGTVGYTEEEVMAIPKSHRASFRVVEISGDGVEQATAAPGEKRSLSKHECSEDGCDFTSTTAAGIAAHERSH